MGSCGSKRRDPAVEEPGGGAMTRTSPSPSPDGKKEGEAMSAIPTPSGRLRYPRVSAAFGKQQTTSSARKRDALGAGVLRGLAEEKDCEVFATRRPMIIGAEAATEGVVCGVSIVIRERPTRGGTPCCAIRGREISMVGAEDRQFGPFDAVLAAGATQEATYDAVAKTIVAKVLRGFNGCVMAYGATGSGKTHSIVGTAKEPGVVERALADLFATVDAERGAVETRCECSYVELYLESIRDLLANDDENNNNYNNTTAAEAEGGGANANTMSSSSSSVPLRAKRGGGDGARPRSADLARSPPRPLSMKRQPTIREDINKGGRGVFVEGVTRRRCDSAEDAKRALRDGSRRRTTRGTALNDKSSRSHAVFTLEFERRDTNDACAPVVRAKFHLVDLAGSERVGETLVVEKGLKESCAINTSLSVLGNVVAALVDESRTHVPYRDSKLTRLLQDSLGGNSYTAMLCCIANAGQVSQHTLSTLRFAARAKNIVLKPKVNMDPRDAEIARLRNENATLRKQVDDTTAALAKYEKKNQLRGLRARP